MGLFAYLKNKFSKKKEQPSSQSQTLKYQKGLAKSRAAFADRLEELSKRCRRRINFKAFRQPS